MAYDRNLYFLVREEYEEIRRHNEEDLEERRLNVFSKIPEIEQIDSEIKQIGLKIFKTGLKSSTDNLMSQLSMLRMEQKNLLAKRKALLIENGFAQDELSERFMCDICKDTGVVDGKDCECFKRRLILKSFESSNLSKQLRDQSFKTMSFDMYSREIIPDYGVSPYEHMLSVVEICKNFVREFDHSSENLLFWGEPGLGKTFLSTCIAKELIKNGHSVIYETTYRIFSMLEDYKFKRTSDIESLKDKTEKLYETDLLILDDLGSEFSTSYTNAALFDIINTRMISNKKTIINTNLNIKELAEKYTDRVVSRIMGNYRIVQFIGDDIRIIKSGLNNN
ncbi:MAG: AAA family ATPase [Ruminococcaceae bacterium]|nr:AAA family ATPase [Oscillospiraceae bacterium]